jgi:transposase
MSWIDDQPLPQDPAALQALVLEQHAALEHHRAELAQRDAELERRERTLHRRALEIERLREKLNALLASRYGASSEQIPDEQLRLFNEAEAELGEGADVPEPMLQVPAHQRRRGGRRPLPENLPRIDVVHELDEAERVCPHDGTRLERIGEEITEQLDVVPARIQVLRHIRGKYACPCCRSALKRAPMPAQPIPKSQASPGLLAHVAVSKYLDALPLNRQSAMWQRIGVELERDTLASWMIRCGELVQPLVNLLHEQLLASGVVQCDETTVQVLREPERPATSKSYMWVQLSVQPAIVLFHYAPSREGVIPAQLFEGYRGILHTDGYSAYEALGHEVAEIVHAGCWAHARRRFDRVFKAAGVNPKRPWPKGQSPPAKLRQAAKGLGYIRTLFEIERRIRGKPPDERLAVRREESRPVLDKLWAWVEQVHPKLPPTLALGEAVGFVHNQWPKLVQFCEDGRIELSTNWVESAIRPFVIGRKNWMFCDTVAGAKASANLYSLIRTAKLNELNPYLYLKHVFTELPQAQSLEDIEVLLPAMCDRDALLRLA